MRRSLKLGSFHIGSSLSDLLTSAVWNRILITDLGWTLALISFSLHGVGTLISGAPFLALVHDSAPYGRRGQAMSIVQVVLVVSFAFIPLLYGRLMPSYDSARFTRLVLVGMGGATVFWLFSVRGEEQRRAAPATVEAPPSFRAAFGAIWTDPHTRRYALFLAASAFFAFMQDAILEPFGGDVFGLKAGETTRFNAYWGTGVLVGMIGTIFVTRHRRPDQQISTTAWGLALLGIPLLLLGATLLSETLPLVMPVLVAFGLGFGIFTVGGVSLLMAMSTEEQAGSYLALWSVVQLVARGAGIAAGGLIRDLALTLSGPFNTAYAALCVLEALGLFSTIPLLRQADIPGFAARRAQSLPANVLTAATE